ncbi:transglycosylase SLT domain-containing protein [Magnetospirillum sulfuroxidans]|uniref:Transglycosylase SLT domain-containing protein n=1 Tax=Magnetospirillum sulfuroxidans TaxID=611300 RepID=A0ABS5IHE4_9PROT|nr:transglycosylase SLT domain-containing protein [Magnetospirillum sulfuroxidans]MBR9973843.1 transglycosylase SLT domain-containing protein [Magnetospirillum sulfuroxidans]
MQTSATITLIEAQDSRHQRVARHIRDAAEATGVPFDYLLAQANSESRLDPNAASPRSSAMGLYQFTAGTWLEMVKKHGAEHGLGNYADAITKGKDGRWTVADKDMKKEILEMRKDPRVSALMAGEYASDNGKVLQSKLGRKASTHDLYLAHYLGAGGALKVLQEVKDGQQPTAASILPEAAKANPEEFHHDDGDGDAKSVDDLYASIQSRFRRSMAKVATMAKQLNQPQMNLAELRPEARPQAEAQPEALSLAAAPSIEPPAPLDLSQYSTFPVAIAQGAADENTSFPVRLPPAVNATRADQVTLRAIIDALNGKG